MLHVDMYGELDFWWGNLKERDHLRNFGMDEMMIIKWILKK
jgi:hypothetical protein